MLVRKLQKFVNFSIFSAISIAAVNVALAASDPLDNYIVFSNTVPKDEKDLLQNDILNLKKMTFTDPDSSATRLFNTTLNPENLRAWLYQRSHFVIPDSFPLDASTITIMKSQTYPNPEMPEIERGSKTPDGTSAVKTIMSNIGAALYLGGKMQSAYFSVNIPGYGDAKINSPRVGIFKMGEGMFLPLLRKSGGTDYKTFANSMWRLSVFFHEARHSDGNGKSLGFLHAVCPEGHPYAGYNACDKNLNGPYTIGAQFLKAGADSCTDCSEPEKEALRNTYADSFGRVMLEYPSAGTTSAGADGTIRDAQAQLKTTCDEMRKLGIDVSKYDFCKDQPTAAAVDTEGKTKAQVLDDKPEIIED